MMASAMTSASLETSIKLLAALPRRLVWRVPDVTTGVPDKAPSRMPLDDCRQTGGAAHQSHVSVDRQILEKMHVLGKTALTPLAICPARYPPNRHPHWATARWRRARICGWPRGVAVICRSPLTIFGRYRMLADDGECLLHVERGTDTEVKDAVVDLRFRPARGFRPPDRCAGSRPEHGCQRFAELDDALAASRLAENGIWANLVDRVADTLSMVPDTSPPMVWRKPECSCTQGPRAWSPWFRIGRRP